MKIIWFLILKNFSVCYVAVLCLSCGTQDFRSSLRHVGSLLAACEVLVVACGIWFPDQGSNLGPLH